MKLGMCLSQSPLYPWHFKKCLTHGVAQQTLVNQKNRGTNDIHVKVAFPVTLL